MKKTIPLLALLLLASPAALWAKPVSVTFYPQGATVTEEKSFRPEKDLVITLPAGAEAESLSFSLSEGSVLESSLRTEHSPSPAANALQKELEEVRNGLSRVAAERESLSFERLFWADPPMKAKDKKALEKQAAMSAERLGKIAGRDTELSARERALEQKSRELEARLEELGSRNGTVQTCTLTLTNTPSAPLVVRWTYFLPGASWQPCYRVLADEKAGTVRVSMDAVLRQDSGADWKDVEVTLASAEDMRRVNPPSLPDWVIGEEKPVMRSMNLMAAKAVAAEGAVQEQELATGLVWKLGTMSVPAEGRLTRFVAAHELPAEFCRLVRPLQDTRAYFMATIDAADAPLLPSGQAVFSVNGVENARGAFRLNAGCRDVFFGVDRLVGVRADNLATGDRAGDENTKVWRRSVDITNGHDSPVSVRVEIAAPVLRSGAMRLVEESTPRAALEEKGPFYLWRLDIPAGKDAHILQDITVTLPRQDGAGEKQAS